MAAQIALTVEHADIDVFLDRSVYFNLPEVENLSLVPTSEYWSGCPNSSYTHMPVEEWGEIQRDFTAVFEGEPTNVQVKKLCNSLLNHPLPHQFVVVPEVRRGLGHPHSKPCRKMEGLEFARHVLQNFDLDIAQQGIYANKYITCGGGLDTLMAFFDEDWFQYMSLDLSLIHI